MVYITSIPIIKPNIYTHQYSKGDLYTLTKTIRKPDAEICTPPAHRRPTLKPNHNAQNGPEALYPQKLAPRHRTRHTSSACYLESSDTTKRGVIYGFSRVFLA